MGARQDQLTTLLLNKGYKPVTIATDLDALQQAYGEEINRIYRELGGILPDAPVKFGKFDFACDEMIVELDEEQHFNRYRAITLQSPIYKNVQHWDVQAYKKWCSEKENECLRKASFGKYWTSPSTEKQFGKPAANGILTGTGSPRWKQRAYYDFVKDCFAIFSGNKLIRQSIYAPIIV
jgi:hypothetical protein